MKRAFVITAFTVLIVLGIIFAVLYGNWFITKDRSYLCFSIIGALEAVFSAASLFLYTKEKKGALVDVVYVVCGFLCIPVLFCVMVWTLHWIGIDFLPPPQR